MYDRCCRDPNGGGLIIKTNTLFKSVLLCLLVWMAYSNSLHGPFTFDDWHVISQNPSVRGPSDIPRFFTDISTFSILPGNRDYRPLFLTSMALSWWIGDGSTLPFHIVSVSLHMGCVLLIFFVLRRMLMTAKTSVPKVGRQEAEWTGFLAASLFAVHPLATEAVAYISSQSIPMAAFFYLLAFMLFLGVYSSDPAPAGPARWLRLGGVGAFYFFALLSKPIAITFPVMLLLWEMLLGRDADDSDWKAWSPQRLWGRARKHIPIVAVTLCFLYLRNRVAGNPLSSTVVSKTADETFVHYLTQTKALALYYLRLALVPVGQNHDIEYPVAQSLLDPWFLIAITVLATIGWLLFKFRRQRILVFWTLWFPTCLLVTTYLVELGQRVREARMYLSLVGVCVVAAMLCVLAWKSLPIRLSDSTLGQRSGRRLTAVSALIVLLTLGTATFFRNELWSNELELWGNAAREGSMGTWRAHMNYGLALENAGRADEALDEFEMAVEMGHRSWAYLNLGLAQLRRGTTEDGEANLRRAVSLWPDSPETHFFLAVGLTRLGRDEEAEEEFNRAIALRENYTNAYQRLGELHERQGRMDLALASYEKWVQIEPGQTAAVEATQRLRAQSRQAEILDVFTRAYAAQMEGRRSEAFRLYQELLTLDPLHRRGTFNLAYAYLEGTTAEDWSRAAELFLAVLEIDPSYTEAAYRLASAYWKLGRRDDAIRWDHLYLEGRTHPDLEKVSRRRLAEAGESEND
jgi:tetratricopeptide (TPR) repeat protein